jgi:hypothetical protein
MTDIIKELDILELVQYIGRKKKKLQAVLLQKMEETLPKDSATYLEIRKLILDETSEFTRAIVRQIFGDIEFLIK